MHMNFLMSLIQKMEAENVLKFKLNDGYNSSFNVSL